jgi:hypothetical protein
MPTLPFGPNSQLFCLPIFLLATSVYYHPIGETSLLAKNFYCLPLYLEVGENSLYEGYLMGKNRKLMILIVLCVALSMGSIILQDSNSSAEKNCTYSNISIHSIQGAGHKSPIAGCSVSGIQGIVTLVTSKGFYMQDPRPDNDNRTSEGILVYTRSPPKNHHDPQAGIMPKG